MLDAVIARIAQCVRKHLVKSVFTYQSHLHDDERTLISTLKTLIQHNPDYIDLDANLPVPVLDELASLAIKKRISIIYSYHNWKETPPKETISALYEFFIQMLPYFSSNQQNVLKIVFMATKSVDSNTVLDFCKQYAQRGINLISFCMGELGKTSRIHSILNGCAFTYAYIGEATAPGQIKLSELFEYLRNNSLS